MMEYDTEDLRTIKPLPFIQAFLAALIAPFLIGLVFALVGAQQSALILQVEMIVVAIGFCLTGILTRSKAMGLLVVISAPIAWIPMFILSTLTNGWYVNPYGLIAEMANPISTLLTNLEITFDSTLLLIILVALDLILLVMLFFWVGFFLSTLATGIWTKKGELSIFSVIMKPIAAILVIALLVTAPFVYHGVTTFFDGGISLATGATEFVGIFGGSGFSAGFGAQDGIGIDISDPETLAELVAAAERAEAWFKRSSIKFGQVQGNFLLSLFTGFLPSDIEGIDLRQITAVLSISSILTTFASEIPDLLLGFNSLVAGFDRTFTVLGTTDIGGGIGGGSGSSTEGISATYNPDFNIGLDNISTAIDHFNKSKVGVEDALDEAQDLVSLLIVDETTDIASAFGIIDEAQAGYGLILEIARGAIDFLNATYKTALAIEDLGDSAFSDSADWLVSASGDLEDANDTFDDINTTDLNPDSILPFYGIVEILKDMTSLLTFFTYAATNGTECYDKMDDVLTSIETLDFDDSNMSTLTSGTNALAADVSEATDYLTDAVYFIERATILSNTFTNKTYGNIIDSALKPTLVDFSSMLTTFSANITQMSKLVEALDYTVLSIDSFTNGFALFNSSYTYELAVNPDNSTFFLGNLTNNDDFIYSEILMQYSIDNASMGHYAVGTAAAIASDVKGTWQAMLYSPDPSTDPDEYGGSIAGYAFGALGKIQVLKTVANMSEANTEHGLIQTFFESLDEINLTDIFS